MDNVVDLKKRKEAHVITLDYKTLNSEADKPYLFQTKLVCEFSSRYKVAKITKQHLRSQCDHNKWTDEYVVKASQVPSALQSAPIIWETKEGMEKNLTKN